jgi:RimJ/RimL family protein N-acetyltransferase
MTVDQTPWRPTSWLPPAWEHPGRVELGTGHHLRPIRAADVDLDMQAVMGSQERLWSIYGEAWGWPPATMSVEEDRADLARHEAEIDRHESFNYALFDAGETELLGCVYIDPPERSGADAEISWWVVDALVGCPVEAALDELVPRWIATSWPFTRPRLVGRDLTWQEWSALPARSAPPRPVTLVPLPAAALDALLDGDLARAGQLTGTVLPPFFLTEGWLWRLRRDQVRDDPASAEWIVRAVVTDDGAVVGHAGFHGPPDEHGDVEVGFTVLPEHRGKGWARAALAALLARAEREPDVNQVVATVRPDNVASLGVVRGAGFVHVGEQTDPVDGLEMVFVRPAAAAAQAP